MASKLQFQTKADKVDVEDLWKAFTKDKVEVAKKADPDLFADLQLLEDDGHGNIGVGALFLFTLGPAAPNVEPFTEKIVELDESKHFLKLQGIEGGFLKLGFAYYTVSVKFDYVGESNSVITTTINYDLEKGVDGTQLADAFSKALGRYINSVVVYLQQKTVPEQ